MPSKAFIFGWLGGRCTSGVVASTTGAGPNAVVVVFTDVAVIIQQNTATHTMHPSMHAIACSKLLKGS